MDTFYLLNKDKKILMGYTPKAGCSTFVKMFFYYLGISEKDMMGIDNWVHHYREQVYEPKNIFTDNDLKSDNYFKFKGVRNPYSRAVSSYIHLLKDSSLFNGIDSENITFIQYLELLEKTGVCNVDPHLSNQVKKNEPKYDYIIKVENLKKSINEIRDKYKIKFILKDFMFHSRHHSNKFETDKLHFNKCKNDIFIKKDRRYFAPSFKSFYNEDLINRVYNLFYDDFNMYGYDKKPDWDSLNNIYDI